MDIRKGEEEATYLFGKSPIDQSLMLPDQTLKAFDMLADIFKAESAKPRTARAETNYPTLSSSLNLLIYSFISPSLLNPASV